MLITLAVRSLLTRKLALSLVILAIALSLSAVLLSRTLSNELRTGFNSSVSGTDLIVAARSHPLQVLLYSVFRLGTPTQALSAGRWQEIAALPELAWSFPLVLGDSHRGYAVIGTNDDYFRHFRYGRQQPLTVADGAEAGFAHPLHAVIGAAVARELGYRVGDHLIVSHGSHQHSFHHHDDVSFQITTILAPTGTPVDRSIHVHLNALEALHSPQLGLLMSGTANHDHDHSHDHSHGHGHGHSHGRHPLHIPAHEAPALADVSHSHLQNASAVSAVFIGLRARALTFRVQALLNAAHPEPVSAVLPGVALTELWRLLSNAEQLLNLISLVMLITALLGSIAMLQLSLAVRQPEIGLLRLIGARPWQLLLLLQLEVVLIVNASWLLALALSSATMAGLQGWLASHYGVQLSSLLNLGDLPWYWGISMVLALLAGLIPALSAYRMSLRPANL